MRRNSRAKLVFSSVGALALGACSEKPPVSSETSAPAKPAPTEVAAQIPAEPQDAPPSSEADLQSSEPEPALDPSTIEARFFAATNDPAARIEAIRALTDAPPAAALAVLHRLFPIERREDVKSAMLATLADLDHTQQLDSQFALCAKALAPGQPTRIRYLAIHTLAGLRDQRASAFLVPLQKDPDREIRTAATQALSDLAQ